MVSKAMQTDGVMFTQQRVTPSRGRSRASSENSINLVQDKPKKGDRSSSMPESANGEILQESMYLDMH